MPGARLDTLHAGRGLAALAVVIFHINGAIFGGTYVPAELHPFLWPLSAGVEYFFVLSGFLMTWLYIDRLGNRSEAWAFLVKRIRRIFPLYWVVLSVIIPVYFLVPTFGDGFETRPLNILTSYLLVPMPSDPPILQVAWTLCFEMLFYGVFALLLIAPAPITVLIVIWGVAAFALQFLDYVPYPASFVFDGYILLFLYGIAGALLARRNLPLPWILAVAGALGFGFFMVSEVWWMWERTWTRHGLGLSAALAMAGLVRLELAGKVSVPRPALWLGDISYALYLIHLVVLSAVAKVLLQLGLFESAPLFAASLLLAAAVAAGALLHRFVERPLQGRWKKPALA